MIKHGRITLTAAVILLSLLAGALILFGLHPPMRDFEVNYTAGKRMRLGETLYRFEDEHYMFKYLPSSALLYVPLALLPLETAKAIWFWLTLTASAAGVIFCRRLLPPGRSFWVWMLPVLILAKYYLREFQLGQINSLVTAVLLGMIYLLSRPPSGNKNKTAAGGAWGLAVAMKPYSFIFFPYLAVKKYIIPLGAGLLLLLAALFLPVYYYGFEGNLRVLNEWFSSLAQSTPLLFSSQDNVSLAGFYTKLTGSPDRGILFALITSLILAGLILWIIIKGKSLKRPEVLEGSIILTSIPLVSPLGWDYTFLSAILGVMICIYFFRHYPLGGRILLTVNFAVISLSLYDLLGPEWYSRFMNWSVLTINFLILIGYLAYLRFKEIY